MCWISKKIKIKTAKKDIPVWKIVCANKDDNDNYTNKCLSFHQNFEYILKVRNTTQMSFSVLNTQDTFIGEQGFHSYSNKVGYIHNEDGSISIYFESFFHKYEFGYYSYKENPVIVKCHIPKGSKYAIDKYGEIISNDIVLDEYV